MAEPSNSDRVELTQEQRKAQRARNIAIALALVAFIVVLYLATYFKLGANVLVRPI